MLLLLLNYDVLRALWKLLRTLYRPCSLLVDIQEKLLYI